MPHQAEPGATFDQSRSGLRDSQRRSLVRLLFSATAAALLVFAGLQVLNGLWWVAAAELTASLLLCWGIWRLANTPNLQRWIYTYLVCLFVFFLVIMALPTASPTAFVWLLIMPVLAYLLLGKQDGMTVSVPFMLVGGGIYYSQLGDLDNPRAVIELLNLLLCGGVMVIFVHLYEVRREKAERRLLALAQTDSLTGLPNRSKFQDVLNRTIAECDRSGATFALVTMDIDHFKVINDTMGHDAGDQVLKNIGLCLTERLRISDFVGRLGGEEFGLILRGVKPDDAFQLTDELRQRIADREWSYGDASIRVTASFGIAHWPEHGRQAGTLFRVADRCLYSSKRAGRNRVAKVDQGSAPGAPVVGPAL